MKTVSLSTETVVVFVLLAFAFVYALEGNVGADNWLVWGPALFVEIPFQIFQALSESMPILVPLAIIGLLVYFNALLKLMGEPVVVLAIVLFLVMYMWF